MEDFTNATKEELISQIHYLNRLNKEMIDTFQKTERLEFGWTGNLGQWFWDFPTNEVTFNPLKAEAIGYMKEDLPEKVSFQFFTDKLHPDDKEVVMQMMRDHLKGDIPVWEVKYRIQAKDGSWKVYQDRGKVTQRNEKGEPLFLTGIVFDITNDEQGKDQLESKNKHLTNRLKRDTVTVLHSRSAIAIELAKCVNQSKKQGKPLTVVLLNIDDYNTYEEDFGIVLSEEILKMTAQVIQTEIKDKFIAGRYRESVFLMLLENTIEEEACKLAETIRNKVYETLFEVPRHITVSAGVSRYYPDEMISELMQRTSRKLLTANRSGGNQVII